MGCMMKNNQTPKTHQTHETPMNHWTQINGMIRQGYGVASGQGKDPRYPDGTIALQTPIFQGLGLDLSAYFPGTINLAIAPHRYTIVQAVHTFRSVKWSAIAPPEDFSFFDCRLKLADDTWQPGLIYYPHPETKPEHFQADDVLEIITDLIANLHPGTVLTLQVNNQQLAISHHGTHFAS
jgi:hypothetical protein